MKIIPLYLLLSMSAVNAQLVNVYTENFESYTADDFTGIITGTGQTFNVENITTGDIPKLSTSTTADNVDLLSGSAADLSSYATVHGFTEIDQDLGTQALFLGDRLDGDTLAVVGDVLSIGTFAISNSFQLQLDIGIFAGVADVWYSYDSGATKNYFVSTSSLTAGGKAGHSEHVDSGVIASGANTLLTFGIEVTTAQSPTGAGTTTFFVVDNLSLATIVPEPSSSLLSLIGLGLLSVRRRR